MIKRDEPPLSLPRKRVRGEIQTDISLMPGLEPEPCPAPNSWATLFSVFVYGGEEFLSSLPRKGLRRILVGDWLLAPLRAQETWCSTTELFGIAPKAGFEPATTRVQDEVTPSSLPQKFLRRKSTGVLETTDRSVDFDGSRTRNMRILSAALPNELRRYSDLTTAVTARNLRNG